MNRYTLVFGGMTLTRAAGGVDIRPAGEHITVRLQDADLQEIVDWLAEHGYRARKWKRRV